MMSLEIVQYCKSIFRSTAVCCLGYYIKLPYFISHNLFEGHIHYDKLNNSNEPQITGGSHYTTNMSFYLDPNFVHGVPGNPLHLSVGVRLFVKVFTSGTDWTIKMRVHTCYTKPAIASTDQMKFYLLKNGYVSIMHLI